MSDMPAIAYATRPRLGNVAQRTYNVSGYHISVEAKHAPYGGNGLVSIRLTLQPTSTRSEADITHDMLVQNFLTLIGRKFNAYLKHGLPVTIDTFRQPWYEDFLADYGGRMHDGLGDLYTECRGLSASILLMLHSDFPQSFKND